MPQIKKPDANKNPARDKEFAPSFKDLLRFFMAGFIFKILSYTD